MTVRVRDEDEEVGDEVNKEGEKQKKEDKGKEECQINGSWMRTCKEGYVQEEKKVSEGKSIPQKWKCRKHEI